MSTSIIDPFSQGDPNVPPTPANVYATVQSMIDRFRATEMVQISDQSGAANEINYPVVEQAIADASAEIDTYLVSRYALPLAQVPRVLVNVCCDIARYRLYDDRVTEQVKQRYDDAVRLLGKLSTGQLGLGLDVAQQAVPQAAGGPEWSAPGRVFSGDLLRDY